MGSPASMGDATTENSFSFFRYFGSARGFFGDKSLPTSLSSGLCARRAAMLREVLLSLGKLLPVFPSGAPAARAGPAAARLPVPLPTSPSLCGLRLGGGGGGGRPPPDDEEMRAAQPAEYRTFGAAKPFAEGVPSAEAKAEEVEVEPEVVDDQDELDELDAMGEEAGTQLSLIAKVKEIFDALDTEYACPANEHPADA